MRLEDGNEEEEKKAQNRPYRIGINKEGDDKLRDCFTSISHIFRYANRIWSEQSEMRHLPVHREAGIGHNQPTMAQTKIIIMKKTFIFFSFELCGVCTADARLNAKDIWRLEIRNVELFFSL